MLVIGGPGDKQLPDPMITQFTGAHVTNMD